MTKQPVPKAPDRATEPDPTLSELFVFGVDERGGQRGGRFMGATDAVIKAGEDCGYRVIVKPPVAFAKLAMALPTGRVFSSGKVIFPTIRQTLYGSLAAAEKMIPQYRDAESVGIDATHLNSSDPIPDTDAAEPLPTYPALPVDWDDIDVGSLVLISGGNDIGWWEAVVTRCDQDILTLRLRDEPKQGTFVRHRLAVGLINPGPPFEEPPFGP